ncbi:MAG: carbamoyltransferase HypF [Firmicutes bacterium]|nr:carbamoyltransferase HypF [Bacillota bacterium]
METVAREIRIEGVVQGVGFRPFVYRLAHEYGIKGWVLNSSEGVTIWAEAGEEQIAAFYQAVLANPPKLAIIVNHYQIPREVQGFDHFFIKHSMAGDRKDVIISPDVSICSDCYREIMDPRDRRYRYPFTNCTNCGPRFTIIMDVPYDRNKTTMRDFPMCPVCAREFEDPLNRRFHAQPNACPDCGPQVTLRDQEGNVYPGLGHEFLKAGKILAVKGLGGFHLVCDARRREAVAALRRRKIREFKPFAVMCRDLQVVEKYCFVSPQEAELLESPAHPIVILARRRRDDLPPEIAPGINTLGVMLPYTPLHHLLFDEELEILIMTSANISDDPLIIDNDEALARLKGIADYYLMHNRRIYNRCDDSLAAVVGGEVQIYRRARGYVPLPVDLPEEVPPILGCGGELKNTFCMTKGRGAYLSQHLGDLNHYGNYRQFLDSIPRFEKMLDVKPEIIAYDLHPEYMATRWAKRQEGVTKIGVQHHHAHMASCLAENQEKGPALGIICDGTGYGTDGAIWGFEFFAGTPARFERMAHLAYVPLPGEVTIKRPARMAFTYLYELFGTSGLKWARRYLPTLPEEEQQVLIRQLENRFNTVPTSSCGRLFDAVSALLGICTRVQYEAQAAMEMEAVADPTVQDFYGFEFLTHTRPYQLGVRGIWEGLLEDLERGTRVEVCAGKFHLTLAVMMLAVAERLREETGLNQVVLSGGVFQNNLLFCLLREKLKDAGFRVLIHRKVPANDGGISLGQVYIASEVIKGNVSCNTCQDYQN